MKRLTLLLAAIALFGAADTSFAGDGDPPPSFKDKQGICILNPLAAPHLMPGTKEWNFRTRISEGTAGVCANFDGAFTVVTWGCGTECQDGAMVDRTDGKIYWLPDLASYGYEYHAESSLLIVNPFSKADFSDGQVPDYLWREFYEFSHSKWVLLYRDKGYTTTTE